MSMRSRITYHLMTLAEFLSKESITEGKHGTKSYRSVSWNVQQPVEWDEVMDERDPGIVRKRVTKVLVTRGEIDYPDADE